MAFADVLSVVFIILGFLIAFPAYWLGSRALWPGLTRRAERCYRDLPVRTTLLGIPVTLVLIVLNVVLLAPPNAAIKFVGALFLAASFGYALAGVAGLAGHIGSRLTSPIDAGRPWRATLRGAVILELTFLLPVLGWFLILPLTLLSGVGAATIGLLRPDRIAEPAPELETAGVP